MTTSRYIRGRRFEHRVKRLLEERGYIVVRSAGSKGPFDLVALRFGEILLIQCKLDGNLPKAEKRQMIAAARVAGGKPLLAIKDKRTGEIRLAEVSP